MGRHTTLKVPKASTVDETDLAADPSASIRHRQAQLEKLFDASMAAIEGDETNPALLREISGLARAMTGHDAELRQHQKDRKRSIADIPLDLIMEYLRTLPQETRDDLATVLTGADALKPLL